MSGGIATRSLALPWSKVEMMYRIPSLSTFRVLSVSQELSWTWLRQTHSVACFSDILNMPFPLRVCDVSDTGKYSFATSKEALIWTLDV